MASATTVRCGRNWSSFGSGQLGRWSSTSRRRALAGGDGGDYGQRSDPELDAAVAAEARYAEPTGRPLLANVITETFRIRPAAWLFSRRTVAGTELGGHRLPAGADVLISPYVQHHLPEVFADPERFDPGRWAGTATRRPMISSARSPPSERMSTERA